MTEAKFKKVQAMQGDLDLDDKSKMMLYGLYKQITVGPCTAPAPDKDDMMNYYKHKAWTACKSLSKEDAMKKYIEVAEKNMTKEQKSKL